jgi:flagellar hook assembly protein FlgD
MDHVRTVCEGKYREYPGDWYETWDGTNSQGKVVANGAYFYKMTISGQGTYWGKIIILD